MIELFTIFGKGGIVLWCFQEGGQLFTDSINQLIREVLMQERGNTTVFKHNDVTLKYKLDNEFELVFIVVYQSAIQLAYTDQLLSDVHKNSETCTKMSSLITNCFSHQLVVLTNNSMIFSSVSVVLKKFLSQQSHCKIVVLRMYHEAQISSTKQHDKVMRKFEESEKSKKTIASIIERPNEKSAKLLKEKEERQKRLKQKNHEKIISVKINEPKLTNGYDTSEMKQELLQSDFASNSPKSDPEKEEMQRRRAESEPEKQNFVSTESKKGKQARVWDLSGNAKADIDSLDYSKEKNDSVNEMMEHEDRKFVEEQMQFVGHFKGDLPGFIEEQSDDSSIVEDEDDEVNEEKNHDGWFLALRSLVGNKKLTAEDIKPVLDKMRETLIAEKLCQSVEVKLEGKVIGTFSRVASIVKESVREALVQLLTPKRRVDLLRDILEAKNEKRPYIIVFCGVNGVGKSTNLAKITFWLNENGHKVLIAAADTFRAGAVEQLRTHTKHLNALHANSVQLYEQGYGKDPAGLAAAAISIAAERGTDVVLVDTAGRMQDNEPLMRSLAKLIQVNKPDLVLFVGEALVGNEAVDQLVKFNQALADHAALGSEGRLIDGIVLTKFDTIDDKVGAAISMTYVTGQPIVFVGTGQTYKDLKSLNASAVVHSLLK
ncbi:Signal recognition particle receptor subunit alpha [Dirofilaria immitis]|nr:Signal recognition particle receptor subunit alpha [Dirofilaria immitis]